MASVIGSLEIELLANIARLQSDMNKATGTVDRAMGSISKAVGSAQSLLLGLGVGVSFSALIGQVSKAIGVLGDLDDMAQKTGSSVENLSRLQKVATQFGADFGAIDVAIGKLSKGLAGIDDAGGKTAKALNAIGISQQFVKDNDPSEVMIEVAKKLQNYQDGASKAALATDLFGKAGIELLPYLNDVADNVDRFAGVSAEAAAKAAKLQDDLGGLKVGFSELVDTVTIGMLPAMNEFIGKLNQVLKFKSLFSSVGGIEEKDYDKEIAKRLDGLKAVTKSRDNLSKPTMANKINDFIYGDVGDLNRQITIYNDEIKALKELKAAKDAINASPYVSPNSGKPALDYKGAEAEEKIESDRTAAAAKAEAARQKSNAEALKDIQREVDFEFDIKEALNKKDLEDAKALKDQKDKLAKEEYEDQIKYMDLLQKESDKRFQAEADAIKKIEDDRLREQEKISDQFSQSLTDAIFRGFEDGKSFIKNFKDTLINSFKTLVLQPTIKFLVDSSGITAVLGGLSGGLSGNANAAGNAVFKDGIMQDSQKGMGGLFSSVKDFFSNGNSSFISAIEGFGANIANGMGGIRDAIGGFVGENAGAIADGFGYFGAVLALSQKKYATAAGTAIGTAFWGPIGGAIGGAIGGIVDSFIGKSTPKRDYAQVKSSYKDDQFAVADVFSKRKGSANVGAITNLSEAFATQLGGFLKEYDAARDLNLVSAFSPRAGKKTNAGFGGDIGGVAFGAYDLVYGKKDTEAFQKYVDIVMGTVMVQALQASQLSAGIKKFFDGVTSKEAVVQTMTALLGFKSALEDLPAVFNAVRNGIDTTAYTSSIAQLQAQFAATQTFVGLFYTQAENFGIFTDQLSTQLESLNKVLPTSRDEYRAWVDGMKVIDAAGRDQFNGLVALAPAMDAYFKQLDEQKNKLEEVTGALREETSFKSKFDYNFYKGLADNYSGAFANKYTDGGQVNYGASNNTSVSIPTNLGASNNTTISTSDPNLLNAMSTLIARVDMLQASMDRTQDNTKRTAQVLINVSPLGDSIQTKAVV